MDFSFGVLTYNSEKFIIDTLESIKFQVVTYGAKKECELIISDDGSRDNTVSVIEKWLRINECFFSNSMLLTSESNKGTVVNYHKVFNKIAAKKFHIIGGDDLFSRNNIFEFADKLNDYDIITSFPICLDDNTQQLFIDYRRLQRHIYHLNHKPYTSLQLVDLELFGSFLHTPSTLFRRSLYSDDVSDFVKEFVLYEDDPKWLKLLSATSNIYYSYVPIIIYRYHGKSVCHASSDEFDKDRYKLNAAGRKMTHSFWMYLYLILTEKILRKKRGEILIYSIRGLQYIKCRLLNRYRGHTKQIFDFINEDMAEENKYFDYIKNKVANYK